MKTKKALLIVGMIGVVNFYSQANFETGVEKILNSDEIKSDFGEIMSSIALNCLDPSRLQQNYVEFIEEMSRLAKGFVEVGPALAILTGTAKRYPNLCNVYTDYHASTIETENKLMSKKTDGPISIKTYSMNISYYWPKYMIDVTETGGSPASFFTEGNSLYSLNRKISDKIELGKLDEALIASAPSESKNFLALNASVSKMNRMRITGSTVMPTLEAHAWPVALSHKIAKDFTVCGPEREKLGLSAGGIKWPVPMVPMTCPVATSEDIPFAWDTGAIDLISADGLTRAKAGMDIRLCGADIVQRAVGKFSGKISEVAPPLEKLQGETPVMRSALMGCSFPLSSSEGMVNNIRKSASMNPLSKVSCTPWGALYPRSGKTYQRNDYTYANTALRFKSLANDVFGLEIGADEKVSSYYPFDTRAFGLYSYGDIRMKDSSTDPLFIAKEVANQSLSLSYKNVLGASDRVTATAIEISRQDAIKKGKIRPFDSKKRVYTIWEKISCVSPAQIQEIKVMGQPTVRKYNSCQKAIRVEAYKLFQQKYLRRLCDLSGQTLGVK
ncbi:hypothetical protein [Halobacteriovorax sp. CON-3]|uniref:hypothetical protein n=1 Tax=Halobacteriovorax sp. CON-3 TaxID=3157710 RepID=UPI003714C4C5